MFICPPINPCFYCGQQSSDLVLTNNDPSFEGTHFQKCQHRVSTGIFYFPFFQFRREDFLILLWIQVFSELSGLGELKTQLAVELSGLGELKTWLAVVFPFWTY